MLRKTKNSLLDEIYTIILAGGQGQRLYPLTKNRAKPAVPFAGIYRIIDFVLSNCLNTGLRKMSVLTQYKSLSLDNHLKLGWNIFNYELDEYINAVPPQHSSVSKWYAGTADAVFKNIELLQINRPKYVLILSGDHIYKMNYKKLLEYHISKKADATAACIEFPRKQASGFGIMQVDKDSKILGFQEKPKNPKSIPGKPEFSLSNMGVYIFNTEILVEMLSKDARVKNSSHDFGKNIIPDMIKKKYKVYSYNFYDNRKKTPKYWRDIGTIDSYYEANIELTSHKFQFDLFDDKWPIRTLQKQYSPAKIVRDQKNLNAGLFSSIVSHGCIVNNCTVANSVLSYNVVITTGSNIQNSIIFENTKIGRNVKIKNAIIDKDITIPDNMTIGYDSAEDKKRFIVDENGIVIVPQHVILSD